VQKKFLDRYSGQSTNDLISLESEYRTDSLVLSLEEAIQQKEAKAGKENLTEEERIILAVEALEREVNNGGYEQFFLNSSNEFTSIIVESLKRIDCPRTAEITQMAIDAIGISGPVTVQAIESAMGKENDQREARLSECDDLYYRGEEDIAGRLFDFIKENRTSISLP
jgi:hypothetical protein